MRAALDDAAGVRPRSRARATCALALAFGLAAACKGSDRPGADAGPPPPPPPPEDALADGAIPSVSRPQLLSAIADCTLTTAREFLAEVGKLEAAVAALAATPGEATLAAARTAFNATSDAWQVADAMQVGPAAPATAAGGQDLRDQIYAWPLTNRCAVEEAIVARSWEPSLDATPVSRRGLGALEYLLFYEGTDTACTGSSTIVASGSWAALGADERAARKRAYAAAAVADVRKRATALVAAWDPAGGNFVATLSGAGPGNALFPTTQRGLNAVAIALFYLEHEVKDLKVARPLGLRECATGVCPDLLESPYANRAVAHLRGNVSGFRRWMEGCGPGFSGVGFDDLLVSVGAHDLATRFGQLGANVAARLADFGDTRAREVLMQSPGDMRAVYDSIKSITDLLKTELRSVLNLELPAELEGDND